MNPEDYASFDASVTMDPAAMEAMGQMDPAMAGGMMAMFAGFMLVFAVIGIAFYVYFAICLMKIAKKTNTENAWMAWIPIANLRVVRINSVLKTRTAV